MTANRLLVTSGAAGASFTSPRQLRQAIDDFFVTYNATTAPFEWKKLFIFFPKLNVSPLPSEKLTAILRHIVAFQTVRRRCSATALVLVSATPLRNPSLA